MNPDPGTNGTREKLLLSSLWIILLQSRGVTGPMRIVDRNAWCHSQFCSGDRCKQDAIFFPARCLSSFIITSVQVFRHKMDVSYSESSDYYSLDSYRDFEDFCEAVIRQTVEESRTRGPRHWASEWVTLTDSQVPYIKFHITNTSWRIWLILSSFWRLHVWLHLIPGTLCCPSAQ